MPAYTGKDHIRAAFRREFTDRVPFYPQLGHFCAQLLPCSIREYLTDSDKFAEAQFKAYQLFKPDVLVMLADLIMVAEAMGTPVFFPEDSMCLIEENLLKEKSDLDKLEIPDPQSAGRLPYYLDACRKVGAEIKDSSVGSVVPGPWTIAIGLRDLTMLFGDCVKDPPFVHALMEFCCQAVLRFAIDVRKTGIGVSLSEAPASCSLVSPQMYKDFIFPYHKKVISDLRAEKIGVTIHVCGYADPILEDLVNTGANAVSIDSKSDLARMMTLAKDKAVVIGNVDTKYFYTEDREEMEKDIQRCVDVGAGEGGFILSSGCEVPGIGAIERVNWFMEIAEKACRYV